MLRAFCLFLPLKHASGGVAYVSPNGDDSSADNTMAMPYRSLSACAAAAGTGGTCIVMGGRYHAVEEVLTGLRGVTIAAAAGETPIFDGTLPLIAAWEPLGDGTYRAAVEPPSSVPAVPTDTSGWACASFCQTHTKDWVAKCAWSSRQCSLCPECPMPPGAPPLTPPSPPLSPGTLRVAPWQLFAGDAREVVGVARWPDAQPWTTDAYARDHKWRHFGPGTDHDTAGAGLIVDSAIEGDAIDTLAATDRSFQGCVAVLNNGHCEASGLRTHASPPLSRLDLIARRTSQGRRWRRA